MATAKKASKKKSSAKKSSAKKGPNAAQRAANAAEGSAKAVEKSAKAIEQMAKAAKATKATEATKAKRPPTAAQLEARRKFAEKNSYPRGATNVDGNLYGRLAKVEAHQKRQDGALMALAQNADQLGGRISNLEASRDEIIGRLGEMGAPKGYRRFTIA